MKPIIIILVVLISLLSVQNTKANVIFDIDEILLAKNEMFQMDLSMPGEGLDNYDENTAYVWKADNSEHIYVNFNLLENTATLKVLPNWTGSESITFYCKETNTLNFVSTNVNVSVEDDYFDIKLPRANFLTTLDYNFDQLQFSITNSDAKVTVSASVSDKHGVTSQLTVTDLDTGISGTNITVLSRGKLSFLTPNLRNNFKGTLSATNLDATNAVLDTVYKSFTIQTEKSNYDWDGDQFIILYNNQPFDTSNFVVNIENGHDLDTLTMKVIRNKAIGSDGVINLDSIVSDHGFKSISLKGGANLIDCNGPLGSCSLKGGGLGQLIVRRGDLGSLKVKTAWDSYYQEFTDVSCLKGVSVDGEIGSIVITGSGFGLDNEPALIESKNGSINSIITKLKVKSYIDTGDKYIEVSDSNGANIYANILTPKGSIGKILASGGSIGTPAYYEPSVIMAKDGIGSITTKALRGDWEILGGFLHADILTDGTIGTIKTIGGDICASDDVTFDYIDDLIEYPIYIKAVSVGSLNAKAKVFAYADPDPDFREWDIRGGSVSFYANLITGLNSLSSKGGNLCLQLNNIQNVGVINAKKTKFRAALDEPFVYPGGSVYSSVIAPNCEFMSADSAAYLGAINAIKISDTISNCWIGTKGPIKIESFKYSKMLKSSIWSDGQVITE